MFITALFTITKRWAKLKGPLTDEQNVVHAYSGILFNLKKEGNLTHATTWMKLENIMLNEISQSQKDKYCMIPLI